MSDEINPMRGSMATRLLRIVFGFFFVIVLFFALGQMAVEYRYQKDSIRREFGNLQTTFEPVLAQAIWNLDEDALRAAVQGMIELPVVVGMKVVDENGTLIAIGGMVKHGDVARETGLQVRLSGCAPPDEKSLGGEAYRFEMFEGEFPIRHAAHRERNVLGRVTIYSNTSVILDRVKMGFQMLGAATVVEIGLLWLIFRLAFARMLGRPLTALTGAVRGMTLDNLDVTEIHAISGSRDELGELAEAFTRMLQDLRSEIAKRKDADEGRRASEAKLNSIMSTAPEGIGLIRGRVFDAVNQAMCGLTGYPTEELVGRETRCLYPTEEAYLRGEEALFARLAQQGVGMAEVTWLSKDGRPIDVLLSAAALVPHDPECGITFVAMDITERKQTEERLRQADKMSAIGQLAGGIAHDFNNMLGGIMGAAELLQQESDAERDQYLRMIIDSAARAAELTGKLLAFSRKQPASASVIDALRPLRDALSLLASTADKRIVVHASLLEDEAPIVGSPAHLQSVFLNLLINATHAMPEGGEIFVSTRRLQLDATYCEARGRDVTPGPFVEVAIRDTGCGIRPEHLEHIFEPFFTTKAPGKGTGLGLAVVHGTIKQHKGIVTVYSEVGTGTCFHVLLPLATTGVEVVPAVPEANVRGRGTILLVDDEPVMRITASAILEELGYEVLLAENGIHGLARFEQEAGRIDLVILDMVMPEMNGRDCFFAMKKIRPEVRAILASGFSQEEEVASMKAAGLLGFVLKPYRGAVLNQAVREAMRTTDIYPVQPA